MPTATATSSPQIPKTFSYEGNARPYTVAELAKLPVGPAREIIERYEREYLIATLGPTIMDHAEEHGIKKPNCAIHEIGKENITWLIYAECKDCEGDGGLYTRSGKYAQECYTCDGAGHADDIAMTLITDYDGAVLEIA